jgi:hypothetical protein
MVSNHKYLNSVNDIIQVMHHEKLTNKSLIHKFPKIIHKELKV